MNLVYLPLPVITPPIAIKNNKKPAGPGGFFSIFGGFHLVLWYITIKENKFAANTRGGHKLLEVS
jgi:hypothetical protein